MASLTLTCALRGRRRIWTYIRLLAMLRRVPLLNRLGRGDWHVDLRSVRPGQGESVAWRMTLRHGKAPTKRIANAIEFTI